MVDHNSLNILSSSEGHNSKTNSPISKFVDSHPTIMRLVKYIENEPVNKVEHEKANKVDKPFETKERNKTDWHREEFNNDERNNHPKLKRDSVESSMSRHEINDLYSELNNKIKKCAGTNEENYGQIQRLFEIIGEEEGPCVRDVLRNFNISWKTLSDKVNKNN